MHQVIDAVVDEAGRVQLASAVPAGGRRRALLVILDDETVAAPPPRRESERSASSDESAPATTGRPKTTVPDAAVPTLTETALTGPPVGGGGRYRIDRPLGEGGMGEAFVGTDTQTGRRVCIKSLRPGIRREVFVQEWRSLSRVDSPYVVRFLDSYEQAGALRLVMEYVDGPTLADRLKKGLAAAEIRWLALTLMRGVQAMHELDVIHCDLKPQNVLVYAACDETLLPAEPDPRCETQIDWVPKIIDFGLAVLDRRDADGNETACGRFAGTPAYMAPEQFRGSVLSPACDVYAVGLILWEALSGRPAFSGTPTAIMSQKLLQPKGLRVESLPRGVPDILGRLVPLCTDPQPSRRPSAREFVRLLERAEQRDPGAA